MVPSPDPEDKALYLVANTSRPTGDTRVLAVGVAPCQVCVGRALLASVGVSVDVKPSRAGNAGGAGPLGVLGYQSAGPTHRRHPIQDVRHTDGVQLHHVTDITTHLQTYTGQGAFIVSNAMLQYCSNASDHCSHKLFIPSYMHTIKTCFSTKIVSSLMLNNTKYKENYKVIKKYECFFSSWKHSFLL